MQQRPSFSLEDVGRILRQRAVALPLHDADLKLVRLEGGGCEIHDLDRVERDGQAADAGFQSRGGFRDQAPAQEVLNCQAKD